MEILLKDLRHKNVQGGRKGIVWIESKTSEISMDLFKEKVVEVVIKWNYNFPSLIRFEARGLLLLLEGVE